MEQDSTSAASRVFGASVIGPLHVERGIPCQDACAFEVFGAQQIVIAVADGLGSAIKSEVGAKIAVETAVARAKEVFSAQVNISLKSNKLLDVMVCARRKLVEAAVELRCELQELACTLIVAVSVDDRLYVAHVGDGAVIAQTDEGLRIVSGPGDSEYINEVDPLTSSNWERFVRFAPELSGVRCVGVITDGCQAATLVRDVNGINPYDRFFGPLFLYARQISSMAEARQEISDLLSSAKFASNSEDDKSLVVGVFAQGDNHAGSSSL